MHNVSKLRRARFAVSAAAALGLALAAPVSPAAAQPQSSGYRPTQQVILSLGQGELVSLPRDVANVWTSNAEVADIQVNSPRQIGLFGKANGEATVIATAADGSVVYGAQVRVSQNISSTEDVLRAAMPGTDITVSHVGQVAVINGTVRSPEDSAQAELLVRTLLNPGMDPSATTGLRVLPVNRLRVATPQQVMLRVRIAEVSRSYIRELGVNLAALNPGSGFSFFRGARTLANAVTNPLGAAFGGGFNATTDGTSTFGGRASVGDVDLASAIDARDNNGHVTILAEPNLTSLSGETANFLAGGEFPVPIAQTLGQVTIEYKQYGVGLAFTPFVLADGRISMRVRPEVSELSTEGSIRLNGFDVPALTTRRAETTVELGSGQSFMIAGLLRNTSTNTIDKTPFLGNLPVIGALFRSNRFRRAETELVIIVTPFLVQPMNPDRVALPTDGFRAADDGQRLLGGEMHDGRNRDIRPEPSVGAPRVVPGIGAGGSAQNSMPGSTGRSAKAPAQRRSAPATTQARASDARPGFDF